MSPAFVLLLCLFIDLVGFGIILPILPFIVQSFGGGEMTGGLLFGIYAAMAALFGPLWGRLSDRIGRKRALMLTLFGAGVSYVLLGLAHSMVMVFVARGISGAMAGNVGVAMAAMADLSSNEGRTRAMGLIGVSFGLGFAAGPGLAAALASFSQTNALALSAFAAAILSFTACLLAFLRLPKHLRRPDTNTDTETGTATTPEAQQSAAPHSDEQIIRSKRFLAFLDSPRKTLLLMQFVVSSSAQSMVFSMTGFWANDVWNWNERQVGFLIMAVGLVIAALQAFVVSPLADRLGEVRTYLVALCCSIIGCLMVLLMPTILPVVLLAFPLMMGGMTLSFPVLNSLVSQRNEAHVQGAALGLANGFSAIGRVIGPTLGGGVMAAFGPRAPFMATMTFAFMGVVWALFEIRNGPKPRSGRRLAAPTLRQAKWRGL
ncbi:tetracycline resistance MFS efflux pump [Iodidimonas gelatinilytica]|uniref:Tetracycline resistance MFS efflux pump n=1 Tax=Iodidimonas gelatinilytica TaxID=1236966 RepID=A0A5A7MXC7_9PROT|nr:MFS transporter [Iodidimonas gelatinilytica]GEQ99579.1 tetracycline resistance MFS efflux pump [Iodidimonas gelatinilytica]